MYTGNPKQNSFQEIRYNIKVGVVVVLLSGEVMTWGYSLDKMFFSFFKQENTLFLWRGKREKEQGGGASVCCSKLE